MKTHEEIAQRVLERRNEYVKTKKQRQKTLLKIVPAAASFCLIVTIAIVLLLNPPSTSPHGTDAATTDDNGRLLWLDDRAYNMSSVAPLERAYILPWEYKTDAERYLEITVGGTRYQTRSAELPASLLGEYIADGTAMGYDIYTDTDYFENCAVYAIAGISAEHLVAMKLYGSDAYYVFQKHDSEPPMTFGALCDRYALTSVLSLTHFYSYKSGTDSSNGYYSLTDAQSEEIQAILSTCRAAEYVDAYSEVARGERVSFSITSEALGIVNRSFRVGADGYLVTNLADYGYAYNIGEEAARKIIDYARSNGIAQPSEQKRHFLTGTITAIGDGYIMLDDSIMMQNEDDGIVFTVYLNDFRVRRYVDCGHFGVGDTVRIEYDGKIYADTPTIIENTFAIEEVIVSTNGNIAIPE